MGLHVVHIGLIKRAPYRAGRVPLSGAESFNFQLSFYPNRRRKHKSKMVFSG